MTRQLFRGELTNHLQTTLVLFYVAAFLSVLAVSLAAEIQSFHGLLPALAVTCAGAAIFFLLSFLRTNDERERQTNYRALTFAFTGTLLLSATIGFLQAFGLHTVSWLGIPPLMIILWSIGLILCSWRYR